MNKDAVVSAPQQADYIYIVSRGHSGSTLLELLLGNHPELTSIGEIEKLSLQFARGKKAKYLGLCSCGKRPMECALWHAVAQKIQKCYGVDIEKTPFSWPVSDIAMEEDYGIKAPKDWLFHKLSRVIRYGYYSTLGLKSIAFKLPGPQQSWVRNRRFVASSVKEFAKTKGVIDASKDYLGMRDMYDSGKGKTKILFLTRSIYAVIWSYVKNLDEINLVDIQAEAKRWTNVNKRSLKLLQAVPEEDRMHVRYEDLCADPKTKLAEICDFLGYQYGQNMLNFEAINSHTIGGNQIRYKKIEKIKEDLAWQNNLSKSYIKEANNIAGTLIEDLGYTKSM